MNIAGITALIGAASALVVALTAFVVELRSLGRKVDATKEATQVVSNGQLGRIAQLEQHLTDAGVSVPPTPAPQAETGSAPH